MARILIANFLFEIVPLALIALGIVLVVRARSGGRGSRVRHYVGLVMVSVPVGVLVYIVASGVAASVRGDGHFYSVPFGGYAASDNAAVGFSAVIWIAVVFGASALIFKPVE